MTVYGLKVAKQGFDALTADPKNLIFDSTKNQLKVAAVLTESVQTTGSTLTVNIPHGMPYTPGYIPYLKINGRWYGNVGNDPVYGYQWYFSVDATNVTFYLQDPGAAVQTLNLKVYVLVDGASGVTSDTNTANPFGIAVSQEGVDVVGALDQELSLSTGFPAALQIADVIEINDTQNVTDISQAHGLDFTPAWVGVAVDNTGDVLFFTTIAQPLPFLIVGQTELMAWTDATNLTVRVEATVVPDITFFIALLTVNLDET